MKLKIFSVYDSKAKAFITPFFTATVDVALRSFGEAANDPNSMFARHPGDYTLMEIGDFLIDTGEIVPAPQQLNHGLALIFQNPMETPAPVDLMQATADTVKQLREKFTDEGESKVNLALLEKMEQ